MSSTRLAASVTFAVLALSAALPGVAAGESAFCKVTTFAVRPGETTHGDRYFWARNLAISGRHEGDLIGGVLSAVIAGEVTGDVALIGQSVEISGHVEDTVRVWAQSLTVTGTIDGDLLAFAGSVNIHPQGHVRGSVILFGGNAVIGGTVDGDLTATAGEILLDGTIGRDAELTADAISVGETARITGNLTYTAREELESARGAAVGGTIAFHDKDEESADEKADEADDEGPTLGSFLWWAWWVVAATLVGFVGLALLGGAGPALAARVGGEAVLGALVGFGAFLLVPAAAVMAMLLVIPLPLGVIVLLLFLVVLYLAKLPVALWLGQRVLALAGRGSASPFLALALGLVLVYLMFEIPFYVGFLLRLITTSLGLGAILLAGRDWLQTRAEPTR